MTAAAPAGAVLAVTGLKAEARIAAGAGVTTLAGGGDAARLALQLRDSLAHGAKAVISFGIAGGLAPSLPAGTVVIADAVEDGDARWPVDPSWRRGLIQALPHAACGDLAGVDRAVAGAEAKARLHRRSGALAVDMESHVAARLAAQYGVPFAALRIIADPAERSLPQAALVGMRPDGTTNVGAVLAALARKTRRSPGLGPDGPGRPGGVQRARSQPQGFGRPVRLRRSDAAPFRARAARRGARRLLSDRAGTTLSRRSSTDRAPQIPEHAAPDPMVARASDSSNT